MPPGNLRNLPFQPPLPRFETRSPRSLFSSVRPAAADQLSSEEMRVKTVPPKQRLKPSETSPNIHATPCKLRLVWSAAPESQCPAYAKEAFLAYSSVYIQAAGPIWMLWTRLAASLAQIFAQGRSKRLTQFASLVDKRSYKSRDCLWEITRAAAATNGTP